MPTQASQFKRRVVRSLDDIGIKDCRLDLGWQGFALQQIDNLYRFGIECIGEQHDFKIGTLHVAVHPALAQVYTTECLKVYAESGHS
jgi:hypothetical protein